MAAANYPLVLEKGATLRRAWTWKDGAGALIDLTGYTARMQVRDAATGAVILSLTTENSGITLGGALGTINLLASAATMTGITQDIGVYDFEMVASNGDVIRLLEGLVQFSPEITQ